MKVKVIATSTSCLDYYPNNLDIDLIRLKIYINNQEYIDGDTLKAYEFYNLLNENSKLIPKTSQPSVGELVNYFMKILMQGYQKIFVITLSQQLSGSFNAVVQAQKIVKDKIDIIPYDTNTVCFSEGYFALETQRLLRKGVLISNIIKHLDFLKRNNTIFFIVNSLTYLINNGRLSKTKGFLGRLFGVKPVLQVNHEGQIVLLSKHLNIDKAVNFMLHRLQQYINNRKFTLYILFTGNIFLKNKLKKILQKIFQLTNILEIPSTPVVGAHVGSNVVGVGVFLH
ncbi:MAG: DegV family protein [Vigna little leaf phytoplasma]|nr:DegV family protein [Vigna little leaf phytoplasma]